ncbi:hypothetical protein OAT67_02280 [Bacteriovoracaceae bacterium]|nr:hypothetical protein [Bacteriovoracaceae bacterium]
MLSINSGLHVLFTFLCLYTVCAVAIYGVRVFVVGRIKRLEFFIEMLKQEYVLREYSDFDEAMENLEYTCDCSHDVFYKAREVRRFKIRAATLIFIFCLSLVGMNFTDSGLKVNCEKNVSVRKLK